MRTLVSRYPFGSAEPVSTTVPVLGFSPEIPLPLQPAADQRSSGRRVSIVLAPLQLACCERRPGSPLYFSPLLSETRIAQNRAPVPDKIGPRALSPPQGLETRLCRFAALTMPGHSRIIPAPLWKRPKSDSPRRLQPGSQGRQGPLRTVLLTTTAHRRPRTRKAAGFFFEFFVTVSKEQWLWSCSTRTM
jgi:hypothetical protein